MLSIGNKKYRNLQEQVGYNTEEIEKIKDLIDGIVIDDKLVVIDSASGSLTEAQMEVLDGPLAFISYNEKVYLKTSESATELVFKAIDIKAEEVGSAYFNIGGTKVVITIATKVYTVTDDLIITSYSKSQIDSIVAIINTALNGKANLSGADFTGDVSAVKIKQSQPNYSQNLTIASGSGITVTNIYSRFIEFNNILYVVLNVKLENNTGSSKTLYSVCYGNFVLPSEMAQRVIDLEGESIAVAKSSPAKVCVEPAFVMNGVNEGFSKQINFEITNLTTANQGNITVGDGNGLVIPDGAVRYITCRLFLTLM